MIKIMENKKLSKITISYAIKFGLHSIKEVF